MFENIECEWPLFWCYLVLDGIFYGNDEQVEMIGNNLEQVLIKDEESIKLVPELFAVPAYKVEEEYKNPKILKLYDKNKIKEKIYFYNNPLFSNILINSIFLYIGIYIKK